MARVYISGCAIGKRRGNARAHGALMQVKETITMATQPPPESPTPSPQPVDPGAPPPEFNPPSPDFDQPSPGMPAGDPGTSQPAEI